VLCRGPDHLRIHWSANEAVRVVGGLQAGTGQEGVLALDPVPSHVRDAGGFQPHHPARDDAEPGSGALLAGLEEELHSQTDAEAGRAIEEPLPDGVPRIDEKGGGPGVRLGQRQRGKQPK